MPLKLESYNVSVSTLQREFLRCKEKLMLLVFLECTNKRSSYAKRLNWLFQLNRRDLKVNKIVNSTSSLTK
jgi:hypothetical protein